MTVRIRFTGFIGERIGGVSSVDVSATTVRSALRSLTDQYPQLQRIIWTGENIFNPVMAVFLNDRVLEACELDTLLKPGDQIDIIAAVSGGL